MGMHCVTEETPAAVRTMVRMLVDVKRGITSSANRRISMADGSTHIVRSHVDQASTAVTAAFPIVTPHFTESPAVMIRAAVGALVGAGAMWLSLVHYLM